MITDNIPKGAMDDTDLALLIGDMQAEPDWRRQADVCCAYVDGDQYTAEQEAKAEELGMPLAKANLVKRMVNVLTGNEARARSGWKVDSDQDEEADVAAAIQVKLTAAQRETMADFAISEAYSSAVRAGIGWVEVSRVSDIWAPYPYRVKPVHRAQMWWDWRAQEQDLSDARWKIRARWMDLDEAVADMPKFADLLRMAVGEIGPPELLGQQLAGNTALVTAWARQQQFGVSSEDWVDTGRKRLRLFEVWYWTKRQAVALVREGRKVIEFDPKSTTHSVMLAQGAKLVRAPRRVLRQAIFAGPHRLMDRETKRQRDPYIPFTAYRKDKDRSPYGPVLDMLYPQDEYNARRSKLMWLLQQAQIYVDSDAIDPQYGDLRKLKKDAMRADAMIVMNPKRLNGQNAVTVRRDIMMPSEQYEAMGDAKNLIQEIAGVYGPMLGEKGGATSGIAINSLSDQSTIATADMNDNTVLGRRLVGEALVDLIIEDLSKPDLQVVIGVGQSKRTVLLNTKGENGQPVNMVEDSAIKVAVDESPNTPAYRMQQQQQMSQILQVAGNNPVAMNVLLPSYIETTSLPNKDHDARLLRQAAGIPAPGDEQAVQAQQLAQKEKQAQAEAIQMEDQAATAELHKANARKASAQAAEIEAKVGGIHPDQALAASAQAAAADPGPVPEDQRWNDLLTNIAQ